MNLFYTKIMFLKMKTVASLNPSDFLVNQFEFEFNIQIVNSLVTSNDTNQFQNIA